jgi:hypothetical protein
MEKRLVLNETLNSSMPPIFRNGHVDNDCLHVSAMRSGRVARERESEINSDSSNAGAVDVLTMLLLLCCFALGGGRASSRTSTTLVSVYLLFRLLFLLNTPSAALRGIVPIVLDLKHGTTRNVFGHKGPVFWLTVLRRDLHDGCLFFFGKLGLFERWVEMILVSISYTFTSSSR